MKTSFLTIAGRVHFALLLLQSLLVGGLLLFHSETLFPPAVLSELSAFNRFTLGVLSILSGLLFALPRTFRVGMVLSMVVLVASALIKLWYGYGGQAIPEAVGFLLFLPMFKIGYPWHKRSDAAATRPLESDPI